MHDPEILELGARVAGALEDERVVAVGVEAVPAAQPLVDEQRQAQPHGGDSGNVERGVLVTAHRVVHPVDDVPSRRARARTDSHSLTEVVRQLSTQVRRSHESWPRAGWQNGHQKQFLPPTGSAMIVSPHSRQGRPPRPYTQKRYSRRAAPAARNSATRAGASVTPRVR